ncbi:MAG: glycerol-3-phosphate dehydrogenase/oxidase [Actinobacteria bacterium]|nr:glycerol-3-phosphate dehydrogenase/oxidase [Actinomycetota bacterium]MBV9933763.1 glycerol-3-phosphate dehydrogenase/oxidase [Actinomycetota bacterium]
MTPPPRTPFDRDSALARLGEEQFDVLVVGGGITGAGVALDAASRGLRTALVERHDFASGTSSKSSKLVHGGLRYLQQKEYFLVYENLAERQRLLNNAPHLVSPLPFLIPIFGRKGVVNKTVAKAYSTALWLYDLTGGLRIGKRHKRVSIDEALSHMPTLNRDLLVAGFLYYDARADDARLTLTIARTAVLDHGAVIANYSPVVALLKDDKGDTCGARLADGTEVKARAVVNAAGVWVDEVRTLDEGKDPDSLRPAKGIHLAVPYDKVPCDIAAVVPVPADRRSIFVVPWGDRVYLGTTDTDYDGPIDDPQVTPEDVDYVLGAINLFVTQPLTRADVLGTWAGLRPLMKGAGSERTADLSRRHSVFTSKSGVVTVTGGKLTTYRRMAADTVDEVVKHLGKGGERVLRRSPTKKLPLRGATGIDSLRQPDAASRMDVDKSTLEHLVGRYGSEARTVVAMLEADPDLARPLVPGLPYLRAEAVYAARYEMALTLEDVLSRRTRALLLARDASAAVALDVAHLVAPELGWNPDEVRHQVSGYLEIVAKERESADLPETGTTPAAPEASVHGAPTPSAAEA